MNTPMYTLSQPDKESLSLSLEQLRKVLPSLHPHYQLFSHAVHFCKDLQSKGYVDDVVTGFSACWTDDKVVAHPDAEQLS